MQLASGRAQQPLQPCAAGRYALIFADFGEGTEGPRLVVYLSRSGNTRVIAGALARRFGADVFELRPRNPWPADYEEMVAWASRLRESEVDVPLAESLGDLDRYRTVFLGFPVWGTDLPAVSRSFLRSHDLAGKTVVPFITYGSSGEGSSMRTVRALAPDARFTFLRSAHITRPTLARAATPG